MFGIIFYFVSALLLCTSIGVIMTKNPVHSVLCLVVSFLNAAVLFIMIGAEYVAMTMVIVYVGAIAVLFLFVVMMLNIKSFPHQKINFKLITTSTLAFSITIPFVYIIYITISSSSNHFQYATTIKNSGIKSLATVIISDAHINETNIKLVNKNTEQAQGVVLNTESTIVSTIQQQPEISSIASELAQQPKYDNIKMIGNKLFTDYVIQLQMAGIILLIAMIGAIVLGMNKTSKKGLKKQNIMNQVNRKPLDCLQILDVKSGSGVNL